MINWIYYPLSDKPTNLAKQVVTVFEKHVVEIESTTHVGLTSNDVLKKVAKSLAKIGFSVETGKKVSEKIRVPVLFGEKGKPKKSFEADGYNSGEGFIVEIEAGRGFTNYHFLKDIFEACMMHDVNYLAIAIRNDYRGNNDYDKVVRFIDTLYASSRIKLPLRGLLVIGY